MPFDFIIWEGKHNVGSCFLTKFKGFGVEKHEIRYKLHFYVSSLCIFTSVPSF